MKRNEKLNLEYLLLSRETGIRKSYCVVASCKTDVRFLGVKMVQTDNLEEVFNITPQDTVEYYEEYFFWIS